MSLLLSIVILDQKEQPVTLRQLQECFLLQKQFYGKRSLTERDCIPFLRMHPQFTLKLTAIGAPKL